MPKPSVFAYPLSAPLGPEHRQAALRIGTALCCLRPLSTEELEGLLHAHSAQLPLPLLPQFVPVMPWLIDRLHRLGIQPERVFEGTAVVRATFNGLFKRAFRQRAALKHLQTAFEAAGIPSLLFKGGALALDYGNPLLRPASDLDLAIKPRRLPEAERVLKAAEWSCVRQTSHSQLWTNPQGIHLDLHLISTPWGRRIWRESVPLFGEGERNNRLHRKPSPEGHFILLALHSSGQLYKKLFRDFLDVQHLSLNLDSLNSNDLIRRYAFGEQAISRSIEGFTAFVKALNQGQTQSLPASLPTLSAHYLTLLTTTYPQTLDEELSLLARFPGAAGEAALLIRSFLETKGFIQKPTNTDLWITAKCREISYYRFKMRTVALRENQKCSFVDLLTTCKKAHLDASLI